jgi:succinylarginine dihydrolase
MTDASEVNFDGLIGPTHNYSGLALGNLASVSHQYQASSPKQAALQGLGKMKLLHSLGAIQGFIPPQERPSIEALKGFGFKGSDEEILKNASSDDLNTFLNCCSASSMWCANAATVTPSIDTEYGKVHITISNLITHAHRSVEVHQTHQLFQRIFQQDSFIIHPPLSGDNQRDEGAANHMRLSSKRSQKATHIFVYGRIDSSQDFPCRQSLEASKQNAQNHGIEEQSIFIEQNPEAITRGVFHNDVIAASNENILLVHQLAFKDGERALEKIQTSFKSITEEGLILIKVDENQLSMDEAVRSYLFNSQIVSLPDGQMILIAPMESQTGRPRAVIDNMIHADNPIKDARFVDLRQSMANGGGPACLRLRMVLTSKELTKVHQGYILDDKKFDVIEHWINTHYRDILSIDELKSHKLLEESRNALDELNNLLKL